jgi:methyl-accepting chemotaxis protein
MKTQWTVGKKLAAAFGLALLLLLLIGGVSFWSIGLLVRTGAKVAHTYQVLENLEALISLLKDAETGQRGYLLTGEELYLDPYTKALPAIDKKFRDVRDLTKENAGQHDRLAALGPLIDERLSDLSEGIRRYKAEAGQGAPAGPKGKISEAMRQRLDKGKAHMDQIRKRVDDLERVERDLLEQRAETEQRAVLGTRLVIILGSVAALLALSALSWAITRGITVPLRDLTATSQRIAAGDLKQQKLRIASTDEIGQLSGTFNGMVDGLRELARQTASVTGSLSAAAAQIMASTQEQAAGTKEQAATVQEITTTMEQVNQSGAQISAKAKQVAAAAEATSSASSSGLQVVQETTRTMGAIREQVEQVAENIVALSEKTQAVGEIIATVNDIAERSNLLALNAAIEAAAAGEQGSRFSVVANEMKNLADQAKDSTVQVRSILGEIQKGINSSVLLTEEAVKRVESGKRQADVTEETIRQMARTTLESVQAFEQIIGAGNQQQIGFEQVAQGMKDIRQAASQTAAATAQLEKAVANLNGLSQELKEAVGRYQL